MTCTRFVNRLSGIRAISVRIVFCEFGELGRWQLPFEAFFFAIAVREALLDMNRALGLGVADIFAAMVMVH